MTVLREKLLLLWTRLLSLCSSSKQSAAVALLAAEQVHCPSAAACQVPDGPTLHSVLSGNPYLFLERVQEGLYYTPS